MAALDPFFTTAPRGSVNALTAPQNDETRVSDFLTVQSLTNFAAMTGAITVAWKALQQVQNSWFHTIWTPLALAELWLVVSLIMSAYQQDRATNTKASYWASTLFIGFLNSLVLFAAAIGINK